VRGALRRVRADVPAHARSAAGAGRSAGAARVGAAGAGLPVRRDGGSRTMKSLIWKEVRQQLVWLLVALAVALWLWFRAASVWDQLVRTPNETALWSLAIPLLYAFALAQLR